ncbi:4Fe-4S dicluster domain-containing protein [Magnetospirillum sp. 64-120]|uniref:4Fe-4S dicluster domain-containing protein n=1 Tax=Magnetospirillum sp. 64-120 TaxID=1895778 RepID=UPI0025BB4795|nr:4Fe-4S dicluster domain-containing protein [Magnetospirillum sp. 64-120]
MKIDNLDRAIEVLGHVDVLADEQLCVNSRARSLYCRSCESACAAAAITLDADGVEVDERLCTGCGACVPSCPAGVFRLAVFDPQRFLDAAAQSAVAHVHCSESQDGGGGVVIPCHMVLDGRLAAAAMSLGVREMVLHGRLECRDCRRGDANPSVQRARADLDRWFGDAAMVLRPALAGERAGREEPVHREDQIKASRRNFLRLAGARAAASAAWLVPLAEPQSAVPMPGISVPGAFKHQPVAYQAVLAGHVADLPWRDDVVLPWVGRSFAPSCSVCAVCAERCPTGALSRVTRENLSGIGFTAALCTNCGLCAIVCPEKSVRAQPARSADAVTAPGRMLALHQIGACVRCGQDYAAIDGADVCPHCAKEAGMDEDWLEMLA